MGGEDRAPLLQTALGEGLLLARPGERRLHLLNAQAAALWGLYRAGLAPAALARRLSEHFALDPATARTQVARALADWRRAGLLRLASHEAVWRLDQPSDPCWPAPCARPAPNGAPTLALADRRVAITCEDHGLRARLAPLLAAADIATVDHALALQGDPHAWRLVLDAAPITAGQDLDSALVATLSTLTELGCRPAERLLVVHGAGLRAPDGRGLLLVAPGGTGKSTLAAALDAAGFGLLSDDVVPVSTQGRLLGLGLPLCLKPGSWPVLAARRPTLATAPSVWRFGQPVRYLPPCHPIGAETEAALLLCPAYRPGHPPGFTPLSPEQALQHLLAAEAVLRALDQAKLETLARWIGALPAYAIQYPDLDAGVALVTERLQGPPRCANP